MELKEGMYVKTLDGIMKVVELRDNDVMTRFKNEDGNIYFENDMMCNPSFNIIDLIEVGDVIIDKEGHKYPINYEFETDYNNEYGSYEITIDDNITLFFKDNLSIVTKEQFESMEYKL